VVLRVGPDEAVESVVKELLVDFAIHLYPVIVVVRQCAIDLAEAEVWMLAVDLVGILVVRKAIQYHFDHFRLRASEVRHAFRGRLNRRIDDRCQRSSSVKSRNVPTVPERSR
jgi:hypothetical protein